MKAHDIYRYIFTDGYYRISLAGKLRQRDIKAEEKEHGKLIRTDNLGKA